MRLAAAAPTCSRSAQARSAISSMSARLAVSGSTRRSESVRMPRFAAMRVPDGGCAGDCWKCRASERRAKTPRVQSMPQLTAGEKAPRFSLPDQDGKTVSSDSLRGKPAVVYFYPKDDTPGCTTEACQFNDNLQQFQQAGVPVVGVSPDAPESHVQFKNKYGLKFTLL